MVQRVYRNKHFKFALKIGVALVFVWYLVEKVDLKLLWENIRNYSFSIFIAAFLLMIFDGLVSAVSLHALYRNESIFQLFVITIKSCFYAFIMPGQLFGESSKVFLISSDKGKLSKKMAAVLIDKVLNMVALFWLGTVGILLSPSIINKGLQFFFEAATIGVTIFLLIGKSHFFCRNIEKLIGKIKINKLHEMTTKNFKIWMEYACDTRAITVSLLCGILYHLIINCIYSLLAIGMPMEVSFWDFCWINGMLTLILLFPISFGGLGIREVSIVGMLRLIGINDEMAFSFSILILLMQILRAAIGGLLILLDDRYKKII